MDAGSDMVEVRSIVDADRFHCLRLVKGKGGLFRRRYCSTDLTLEDILETEDGEERFDELDSGLPGQDEVRERWPARRFCSLPLHPSLDSPVPQSSPPVTETLWNSYEHVHTPQFQKCPEELHGRREWGMWKFILLGNYS